MKIIKQIDMFKCQGCNTYWIQSRLTNGLYDTCHQNKVTNEKEPEKIENTPEK